MFTTHTLFEPHLCPCPFARGAIRVTVHVSLASLNRSMQGHSLSEFPSQLLVAIQHCQEQMVYVERDRCDVSLDIREAGSHRW